MTVPFFASFPAIILYMIALTAAAGREKTILIYNMLSYAWCIVVIFGGPVWSIVMGRQLPGHNLVMFVVFPIIFMIASCPLIDRHSDNVGASQLGRGTWWGSK